MQVFAGARFHRLSAFGNKQGQHRAQIHNRVPQVATVNFEYQNGVRGI